MTSGGFHYLSQDVIIRPFALTHPWDMSPTTTMTVHGTVNPELKDYSCTFDIMCSVFFFCKTISILHNSAPKWRFLFFPPPITNLQRECRSRAPLSAILI